jgi:Fe-S-cluster containining protein
MLKALKELKALYEDFETAANQLEQTIGASICMAGCGKCCEVAVPPAYRLEALFAVSVCTGNGTLKTITDLCEGWLLERHSLAPTYEGPKYGTLSPKVRDEFYSLLTSKCPFLATDKKCMIHSCRPLVCRAYGVTHVPGPTVDFCPRPLGKGETSTTYAHMDLIGVKDVFMKIAASGAKETRVCGMLPSLIFKYVQPKKWESYIADNRIASAKLIGLPDTYVGMITQEQMDKEYGRYNIR